MLKSFVVGAVLAGAAFAQMGGRMVRGQMGPGTGAVVIPGQGSVQGPMMTPGGATMGGLA